MGRPNTVLFDLDGTLIDSAPSICATINQMIAERSGMPVSVDFVRRLVSRGAGEMVNACLGACTTTPEADLADFRRIYGGLQPNPADLYPGVDELIPRLRSAGYRLGIGTNKPQELTERILKSLGLRVHFDAVVGGDRCARPKPHPEHVHLVLAQMGANAGSAVYVGDSEVDAAAARAAGLPFFLVTFGYAMGDIDDIACQARLESLAALPAALQNCGNLFMTRDLLPEPASPKDYK
jgi:phosphoglycolate phosphatase